MCFVSSPELMLRVSYCDHIPSGVRPFTFSNDISETTGLFPSKLCLKHQCTGGTNNCLNFLARVIPLVAMATRYQILKNLLLKDRQWDSNFFLHKNVCQWTVFQIPSKNFVFLKNMAAKGRGHFSIYCYFVNLPIFSTSLPQLLQNESYDC